jgi:glycosyltransferase involved in cell wall biosynthesis
MLIDVTRLVKRTFQARLATGIDRVSHAYVRHYGHRARALIRIAHQWLVLGPRDSGRVFDTLLDGGAGSARRLAACIGRGIAWPSGRSGDQILINTGHSGLEHSSYACAVRRRRLLPLYFAHDLIPVSHPQFARAGEARRHELRLKTMFDTGKSLIVNSQATRAALAHYGRANGLRLPECVVAPLAPAPMPPPSDRPLLAANYFVILGTVEPRKNHTLLLQLWRRLADQLGTAAPKLVVIGRRGWESKPVTDLLDRCPILKDHVSQKTDCSDRELSTWLRHARALLFPSFTEGFGMPLVEALALGVPVIASDLPVFREIAGAIPDYLDPLDGLGWHSAIVDYSRPHSVRRHRQVERMRGYSVPTWSEHFALVDHVIDGWLNRPVQTRRYGGWAHVRHH